MNCFDAEKLSEIFWKNGSNPNLLGSRESTGLEFKENFSFGSLEEYAKTMASFANKIGGYLVFGIKDNPREILGIDRSSFDSLNQEKFTVDLNNIFQPSIEWESQVHDWNGLSFGLIYTHESFTKPVIATKNYGGIKEGDIYFRYRGRSERIHYADLRLVLDSEVEKRNDAWRRVFEKVAKIDPRNTAILDTCSGELTGEGGAVVIDETLIPKLKFIREGNFVEKNGSPTLKLVGDLQAVPITMIRKQRVPIGEDIYIFKPSQVAKIVQEKSKKNFNPSLHTKAWKMFKPRPLGKIKGFKNEYAEFKQAENEYRYSQAWIDFLTNKIISDVEYSKVVNYKN